MDVAGVVIPCIGIGAGAVALYVRLSLPEFTIKVLNGRYPTSPVFHAKIEALDQKIVDLRDVIENRLDALPCHGNSCSCASMRDDLSAARETLQMIVRNANNY